MKRIQMVRRFVFLCGLMCVLSCSTKEDPERVLLQQLGDKTNPDYYLIIPVKSCSGCVAEVIKFVKNHIGNSKITFVLTSNEAKIFNLLLTNDELDAENIVLDKSGIFETSGTVNDYFLLLKTDGNVIVERSEINSVNLSASLSSLSEQLR